MDIGQAIEKHSLAGSIMVLKTNGKVVRRVPFERGGEHFVRIRGWECLVTGFREEAEGVIAIFTVQIVRQYCPTV